MTIRVGLVSTHAAPSVGGIASCVAQIASHAADSPGVELTTVTLTPGPHGAEVIRWPTVGKGLLAMPAKGFTPMLEQNFDVIHVFNAHTPLFLVALGADLPAVATPAWHGASESSLRNLVWKGVTPVVRHRLRGVHIQAASNAEAALITRDFGMTPELIMQGVDRRRRGEACLLYTSPSPRD